MKKHELRALRERIKSLAAESQALNPMIQSATRERRSSLRAHKRSMASDMRHHLIAYCILRGRSVAEMERGHNSVVRFGQAAKVMKAYAPAVATLTSTQVIDIFTPYLPAIPAPPKPRFIGPIRRASAEEWQSERAFRKLRQMPWCMACDSMALFLPAKPAHSCGRRAA
jgi:hypothetical protein